MRATENEAGKKARVFVFSYFELVENQNIFTAPIWWQTGAAGPVDFERIE